MSLFNLLFGCKQVPIKGPDFADGIPKVVHINPGKTVEYDMPGNMTKDFNYSQRYKGESERTLNIDLSADLEYKTVTWQTVYYLDGASWDYVAGKLQGKKGELGRISFGLYLGLYSEGIELYVKQAYDAHLEGPYGPNTSIRKFADREKIDISEVSHRLVKSPDFLERKTINGAEYLYWHVENEFSEKTYAYFLRVIDERHYLAFRFNYYFSARSEEELAEMKLLVDEDIEKFMSRVFDRSEK